MIRARRFVYNADADVVEEISGASLSASPQKTYDDVIETHKEQRSDRTGAAVRQAALERAERREFAHKKYGTESRWRD